MKNWQFFLLFMQNVHLRLDIYPIYAMTIARLKILEGRTLIFKKFEAKLYKDLIVGTTLLTSSKNLAGWAGGINNA